MKKKVYLMMGSIFLLAVLLGTIWVYKRQQTIAASTLSAEKQKTLEQLPDFSEELEIQLLYNQTAVPYDVATDTYYLPQTAEDSWIGEALFTVSEDQFKLYWCEDSYWSNLKQAIAEGHAFSFFVSDGKSAHKSRIVFTGLPIMQLETVQTIDEENSYCKVTVLDPFHNENGLYEITICNGYLGLRGRTSKAFPKKGWDLELVKESGAAFQTSLFGLRQDDDWKLNALYPDATKVREAVCMELWNELAEQTESVHDAGTHMEYFEMITDGEYMGLYGAMEQLDYKQFTLDKTEDVIYKAYAWPLESHPERYAPEEERYGHLIKTAGETIVPELWRPLEEYVCAANFAETEESCDTDALYTYIQKHMNMDNFLNMELYIQTLYAFDNKYKNQYIAADIRDDGDYTLWKIPWDLNYSFGDRFNVEANALTSYNLEWSQEIMPQFMLSETLLEAGNEEFAQLLNEKWEQLRNSTLSLENVQRIAEENMDLLTSSGAFDRDAQRWPEGSHDTSLEEMLEFHSCRLLFLDEHYSSCLNEK